MTGVCIPDIQFLVILHMNVKVNRPATLTEAGGEAPFRIPLWIRHCGRPMGLLQLRSVDLYVECPF